MVNNDCKKFRNVRLIRKIFVPTFNGWHLPRNVRGWFLLSKFGSQLFACNFIPKFGLRFFSWNIHFFSQTFLQNFFYESFKRGSWLETQSSISNGFTNFKNLKLLNLIIVILLSIVYWLIGHSISNATLLSKQIQKIAWIRTGDSQNFYMQQISIDFFKPLNEKAWTKRCILFLLYLSSDHFQYRIPRQKEKEAGKKTASVGI